MEKQDLALWIVNDPEAGLCAAMEQHAPAVKGILNRILPGRPEDVEECMADVFVALWKNARPKNGLSLSAKFRPGFGFFTFGCSW